LRPEPHGHGSFGLGGMGEEAAQSRGGDASALSYRLTAFGYRLPFQ
jgi:hypothetical protein